MPQIFRKNLEKLVLENTAYRRVLTTTPQLQLVAMSIPVGQEIGFETHHSATQFLKLEGGSCVVYMLGLRYNLSAGDSIVIPPNTRHNVKSTGDLKLYSIYSPPEHPKGLVQMTK